MKKLISLLLAMIMVFSLATVAFAATYDENGNEVTNTGDGPVYYDVEKVTFTKEYSNPNAGISPAETFTFSHKKVNVTDGGFITYTNDEGKTVTEVVSVATMPALVDITSAVYAEGEAGQVIVNPPADIQYNSLETVTVTLPKYEAVGIYTYEIKENIPGGTDINGNTVDGLPTTGVVYHDKIIKLVVTVVEQDGKVRVAAVHTEESGSNKKNDMILNKYESGTLAVSKIVTGNLGDKEKEFDVTVTFTAPANTAVLSTISYVEDGTTKTIAPNWNNNTATAVIRLKHDETITFTNIPAGVTYTVVESSYTNEGYEMVSCVYSDETNKKVDTGVPGNTNDDTVVITNKKSTTVDTGIALDSAPYFLMLAVAVVGMVALVSKKRYEV